MRITNDKRQRIVDLLGDLSVGYLYIRHEIYPFRTLTKAFGPPLIILLFIYSFSIYFCTRKEQQI